ncbi:MAG: hypothetical protein HY840_11635 [Bacteroidetes bacterium]|nr:hypothetical protein [Bacteroidota bacterium]
MLNTLFSKKEKVKSRFLSGKKIFLFITSISVLALSSCGSGKKEDDANASVPQGMVVADLSTQGLAALLNVPDSTTGHLEIISSNTPSGVDVKVGTNFQMTIMEGEGNIELKKKDIISDDVRKFVKYVVEDPNAIVWEWQMEGSEPEYHFYAIVKSDNKSYEVFDVSGESFSEKAATQMLDAAKSIHPKAPAKAAS